MKIDVHRILGTSEFRARVAEILDAVTAGETYVITRGGRPIAVISPVPTQGESVQLLTSDNSVHEPIELE
jgi:prevent-host-death family protein